MIAADLHEHRLVAMRSHFGGSKLAACISSSLMLRANCHFAQSSTDSCGRSPAPVRGLFRAIRKFAGGSAWNNLRNFIACKWRFSANAIALLAMLEDGWFIQHVRWSRKKMRMRSCCEAFQKSAPLGIWRITSDSAADALKPHLISNIDPRDFLTRIRNSVPSRDSTPRSNT